VPLLLFGYGPELTTHVLLLMTLAAAAHEAHARKKQPAGFTKSAEPRFSGKFHPSPVTSRVRP
jgi:hypothetical protein